MKEILTGIAAAIGTAVIFWIWGGITKIPNIVSVPSGAVVAFDSKSCPAEGWKEYKAAHGRFIRGIDRSGSNIDPDGERNPGSFQADMLGAHSHEHVAPRGYNSDAGNHARAKPDGRGKTDSAGGVETRPKNVALLYCVKL